MISHTETGEVTNFSVYDTLKSAVKMDSRSEMSPSNDLWFNSWASCH